MTKKTAYPELAALIGAYLGQDMDLWADTVEGAISIYVSETVTDNHQRILDEVARYSSLSPAEQEKQFSTHFGTDFDTKGFGKTVPEFLATVEEIVRRDTGKKADDNSV